MRAAIWPTDRTLPHLRLARNGKQVFSLLLRTSPAGPMFDRRDLRPPLVGLHRQIQVPWRRRPCPAARAVDAQRALGRACT